jgi:5-methylcytosine-specific restriction protein A
VVSKTKRCRTCGAVKALTEFPVKDRHRQKGTLARYQANCRPCHNARLRAKYHGEPMPPRVKIVVTTRTCNKCGATKSLDNFFIRSYGPNGPLYRGDCKPCLLAWQRERMAAVPGVKHPKRPFTDPATGIEYKGCSRCEVVKLVSEFGRARDRVRSQCKDCENKLMNARRKAEPVKRKAQCKTYNLKRREKMAQYRLRTRERNCATAKEWRKNNPDKVRDRQHRRRARLLSAPRVERIDRKAIIERDSSTCYLCRRTLARDEVTLDHVLALARGGSHTADNLRVACMGCNVRKNVHPVERFS